jgi:hypothetical protein
MPTASAPSANALSLHSQQDLDQAARRLNERPRKTLGTMENREWEDHFHFFCIIFHFPFSIPVSLSLNDRSDR